MVPRRLYSIRNISGQDIDLFNESNQKITIRAGETIRGLKAQPVFLLRKYVKVLQCIEYLAADKKANWLKEGF